MATNPPDAELIRRMQAEAWAFETLYRRHVRRVVSYAATRCDRAEDVADLVASTFLAALDSAASFDPTRGGALPWMIGIARHLASDSFRHARREREVLARVAGQRALAADEIAELEERIDAGRRVAELGVALDRLHPRDREPLVLLGHVGLSHREAAQALGLSDGAFRIRLMRARRALRKTLANPASDAPGPLSAERAPS